MRLTLAVLAAAYWIGVALADAGLGGLAGWLWLGVQALAFGAAVPGARVRTAAAGVVALSAGAVALSARIEQARATQPCAPLELVVEARVDEVRAVLGGLEVVLTDALAVRHEDGASPSRILVHAAASDRAAQPWRPGSWVRVALRSSPIRGRTNPGGPDRARALARRGIGLVASEVHPALRAELVPPSRGAGLSELAELRRRGADRLRREGEGGGLLAALGLGEAAALSPAARRALARLGLSHLVAVSGLHLWLVAGPAFLLAASALRRSAWLAARIDTRRAALVLAVTAGAGYAVFTGLAPPVLRALVFLSLLALARLARRHLAHVGVFAAAGLTVAVLDPAAPFAPGVQLSFAATAALVWSAPGPAQAGSGRLRALAAALERTLRISASATAATAALVALHFGVVSPLGWLANAVAVPLTSFVYLPLALVSGSIAVVEPELEAGVLATAVAWAARAAGASLAAVAAVAEWVPARSGVLPDWSCLALSAGLALLCLRAERTALRLGLALLAAAAPLLGTAPALDPPPPRAVFLDVGQGDATVVQGGAGTLLVDGGVAIEGGFDAGERVVLPALAALGVGRLDLVVASHADLDHAGGLGAVLREVPARRLWLPPGGRSDAAFAALVALARARGVAIEERAAEDPVLWLGDVAVETLWPPRAGPRPSRNDGSLVLRVRVNGRVVLLPGDVERAAEKALSERGAALGADLLKLAHHGSRTSSTRAFLDAASPALAVVSAPLHGRFGMPHPETVERLAAAGVPWHWTGRDGALLVGLGPHPTLRAFARRDAPGQAAAGSEACGSPIRSSSSRPAGWTAGPSPPPTAPRSP